MVVEKVTVPDAMYLQELVVANLTKLADDVMFLSRVKYRYLRDTFDC